MTEYSREDQRYQLYLLLWRTMLLVVKARSLELKQCRLSTAESGVLNMVHDMGNKATATELSRHLMREPHSLWMLLERMEKKGLVKRKKGQGVGNKRFVSLTNKGIDAYKKAQQFDSILSIFPELNKEDLDKMTAIMMNIRQNAGEEIKRRSKPRFII